MNEDIKVLVVEDDQDLRESVVEYLNLAGLTASGVGSAAECYHTLNSGDWCVAVVDIGLPDQSGYVLVEYIRANTAMRVIILTARDAIDDRVKGYDSGADIYLVKPVDCRELTAAIISLAQRQLAKTDPPPTLHQPESWSLVRSDWALFAPGGINIALTAKELQFLQLLTTSPGKPVDRDTLLSKLYLRHDEYTSRSLDSLVRRLRAKIMTATGYTAPIKTAHAVGYCFSAPLSIS
ncbi:MAG: response regulator transcription factor [Desulfuromonadales bacterium]|nr:response regulator transcription factor [Desulfuromonadales bacterium]